MKTLNLLVSIKERNEFFEISFSKNQIVAIVGNSGFLNTSITLSSLVIGNEGLEFNDVGGEFVEGYHAFVLIL